MMANLQPPGKSANASHPLLAPMRSTLLQRRSSNSHPARVPPIAPDVLRSSDQLLDRSTREAMESVPEPVNAPLVYKQLTGKEGWQKPPAIAVTVWSDDRGYYYNNKAG